MNKKHSAPKRMMATKKNIARQPRAESDANETNANRAGDQQPGNGSFVIVGVGASAGGPERILLGIDDVTERLESRAALRASEIRFRRLFEAAQDGILLLDPISRKITDANPFMERLLGYTREEFLGKELWQIGLLEDEQSSHAAFRELQDRGQIRYDDLPLQTKDGRAVEVEFVSNLYDEGGRQVIQCNIRDITERKQAEAELRQSEERFRRLLDTLPVGAYTCDAEGLITYFNERAVEAWGRTPKLNDPVERFCGSYRLYTSDGAQIPHSECWMALALKENKVYEGREIVIECPDGSRLTVLAHVNPFYNEAGKLLGAVNIVVDITDRKQAEAVKAQMAAIVESSDDAIVSKDLNGIITSWNKGAQKLFGYTAEEVIGKSTTIIIPPDRENEESYILDHIRRGEVVDHYETVRRRKDGSEIDISLTVSPVRDNSGKVVGASKIARDISDRKRIEIEREELLRRESAARVEAEQTSRLKDEFLATVSHELRSPLNSILGWSRMLSEDRLDKEKTARAFEIIHRNAHAQNQLIGDLLEVSRIITGKLNLDVSEVELIPIINAAIDVVRPAAEAKNIRLISTLDPAAGPVSVDAGRLQQVVWNLLSNAVKFTPGGGQVAISLEREATRIKLIVSDTGEGIEPEFLPFVFDRFRQFEGDTRRAHGGLGLGLAIVRHLVELHGGTVGAASPGKGRGATFTMMLPLAAPREEAGEVGRARPAGAGEISRDSVLTPDYLRGLRVLVVDDEPDALDLLSLMLTNHGAEVKTSASAAEALQTLDEWRPDALVSDIGMPREDGYDLLRKIRAREPERGGRTPAIALTAYARAEDARRALAAGYQMHIPKPVESDLLAATVASLAGGGNED